MNLERDRKKMQEYRMNLEKSKLQLKKINNNIELVVEENKRIKKKTGELEVELEGLRSGENRGQGLGKGVSVKRSEYHGVGEMGGGSQERVRSGGKSRELLNPSSSLSKKYKTSGNQH